MDLNSRDNAEAWARQIAALARNENIIEAAEGQEAKYGVTDMFMSRAGLASIKRLSLMAAPQALENMKFTEIQQLQQKAIRPKEKLVDAETIKFMSIKQEASETIIKFYQRLL